MLYTLFIHVTILELSSCFRLERLCRCTARSIICSCHQELTVTSPKDSRCRSHVINTRRLVEIEALEMIFLTFRSAFVALFSGSRCPCPSWGVVPLLTLRWVLSVAHEADKSRFYYLNKLSCDGKRLLKERCMNNWSPRALNFAATRCDLQRRVGHLYKIFILLFKNGYIRDAVGCSRRLLLSYSPCSLCPICHLL